MFTIYIHILEVAAMYPTKGTTLAHMMDMGSCFDMKTVQKAVKSLVADGFLKHVRERDGNRYWITDKAVEYCHTVVSKHDSATLQETVVQMCEQKEVVESVTENMASEASETAIVGVLDTPPATKLPDIKRTFSMPLYGLLTIGEVVEEFEKNSGVNVRKAGLKDGVVTLEYEFPASDLECSVCGRELDTVWEQNTGVCLHCDEY